MLTLNQRVQGSSACAPTNLFNQLAAHASNDSWEDVEADAQPKYAAQGQPMSFKAYHVLVPKAAVADPEPPAGGGCSIGHRLRFAPMATVVELAGR
jgi:hypothetical protein